MIVTSPTTFCGTVRREVLTLIGKLHPSILLQLDNLNPLLTFVFVSLGGVRNMVTFKDSSSKGAVKIPSILLLHTQFSMIGQEGEVYADGSRIKNLFINLILLRVLLFKAILSPWLIGLCNQPVNRQTRRVIRNLRVVATIFYRMIQQLNPILPPLTRDARSDPVVKGKAVSSSTEATPGDDPKKGGVMVKMLQFAGFQMDETPGYEEFKEGTVEHFLLESRSTLYESLDEMRKFLFYEKDLEHVHRSLEEWEDELLPKLREWCDSLVQDVILEKLKVDQTGSLKGKSRKH